MFGLICANCKKKLSQHETTGTSALYNPTGHEILLCESCFFEEDDIIETERTNNLPERLKKYKENLYGK